MFSFLLHKIFKKGLYIYLSWSLAYPIYNGNIVVRNVVLGNPEVASSKKAELDFNWSSILKDEIIINKAELSSVSAEILLSDPLPIIRAMSLGSNKKQKTHNKVSARSSNKQLEALKIFIKHFTVVGGNFFVKKNIRDANGVKLINIHGTGRNLHIPVRNETIKFLFKCDLITNNNKFPIIASIRWNPKVQKLKLKMRLEDFPISILSDLFDLQNRTTGLLDGLISLEYAKNAGRGGTWFLE